MADSENEDDAPDAAELVAEKRLLESLTREDELKQLRALLAQEPTRDFLWRVLLHCHIFGKVWDANYGRMSLNDGMRQVGLWLLSEICEADPEAEMLMRRKANLLAHAEAAREREARQRRRRT